MCGSATVAIIPRRNTVRASLCSAAPLTRPALPSQSFRHRRRSPHRVCPASRTRPAAAIRRFGRSMGVFTSANEAPSASSRVSSPSRPDNYLPLRRADDGSVNSAVVCSLRYSPSSGRPAAPATPSPEGLTLKEARHPVSRSRRLSPTKRLFRSPTRPIPAAAPRKIGLTVDSTLAR